MNTKQFQLMVQGDEELVDAFVREYYPKVFSYLYRRLTDKTFAKDLTQETFARFFSRIQEYENTGKHLNYLYRIAIHLLYDQAKKHQFDTQELLEETLKDSTYDAHQIFLKKEEQRIMRSWIEELPLKLQDVLLLRYEENLKYKDIAMITGIPVSTIKSQVKIALSLLEKRARSEGWK